MANETAVELPTRPVRFLDLGATTLDLLRDMMLALATPRHRLELACHLVERGSVAAVNRLPAATERR